MRTCAVCAGPVEQRYRFCPWCSAPQRLKLVEFFRPHAGIDADRRRALRVSRYLGPPEEAHVRFSVWSELDDGARAEAAVSIDETEAARLARFLDVPAGAAGRPSALLRLMHQLRRSPSL